MHAEPKFGYASRTCFWVKCRKTSKRSGTGFGSRSELFEKMLKIDPENICLRFWDILGCQVQNDLKTLGNRFLGRDLNFSEKCRKWVQKKFGYASGTFSKTCAKWPQNAREAIFGLRSQLF